MRNTGEYFILPAPRPRVRRAPFLFYLGFAAAWSGSVVSLIGEVFAAIIG